MSVGGGISVEKIDHDEGWWVVTYLEACPHCRAAIRWQRRYTKHPGRWLKQQRFETCSTCCWRMFAGLPLWQDSGNGVCDDEAAQGLQAAAAG